jgi:hypothetical protein
MGVDPNVNPPKDNNKILEWESTIGFADAAVMEQSTIWTRGGYHSRVKLKGLDDDSRFFLRTMSQPSFFNIFKIIHSWIHYVTLNVGGKKVLVNINSIAKRLLLTKAEIRNAAKKEGKLEELVQQRIKAISDNKALIDQLEYTDHSHSETGTIQHKATQVKVISTIAKLLEGVVVTPIDIIHRIDKAIIVIPHKVVGEKVYAEGTFAKVIKFVKEHQQTLMIKLPKEKDLPKAKKQSEHEQQCLKHLQTLRLNTYTQKPYHILSTIQNQVALIGSYIEGEDVTDWLWDIKDNTFDPKDTLPDHRADFAYKLLIFFKETVIRGNVCHNDINPSNIRRGQNNELTVIDFGSAAIIDDTAPILKKNFAALSTYTKDYTDESLLKTIVSKQNKGLKLFGEYELIKNDPQKQEQAKILLKQLKELRKELYKDLVLLNFKALTRTIAEIMTGDKLETNEALLSFLESSQDKLSEPQRSLLKKMNEVSDSDMLTTEFLDSLAFELNELP